MTTGVLGVALPAVVALAARLRAVARAHVAQARRFHRGGPFPLSPGPERVVRGRIETDDGEPPVRVEIEQAAENHGSGKTAAHTWTESRRDVRAAPFYVARDDGEVVRVEPGDDVLVATRLDLSYPADMPWSRLRRAELRPGAVVYVAGELVAAHHPRAKTSYRDAEGWVMRPAADGRLLVGTEALGRRYLARVACLAGALALLVGFVAAYGAWIAAPQVGAAFYGEATRGEVIEARTWETHGKYGVTRQCELTAVTDDGVRATDQVSCSAHDAVVARRNAGERALVPVYRATRWGSTSHLGDEPVFPAVVAIGMNLVGWLAAFFLHRLYARCIPWYERPRLVDRHGGHWKERRLAA